MTMDKQQERLGSTGKKEPPRDNIDLDVIDAMAMGYGCQYGRFKVDHPRTKDRNEERLARLSHPERQERPAVKKHPRQNGMRL